MFTFELCEWKFASIIIYFVHTPLMWMKAQSKKTSIHIHMNYGNESNKY
jgi:hypothetical protein